MACKHYVPSWVGCCVFLLASVGGLCGHASARELSLELLRVPDGFEIALFTDEVPNARSLARSEKGVLFIGTREAGNVYAVVDENQDHHADKVYTIATGLNMPNGVAFRGGSLYVAEVSRVLRYDAIEEHLGKPPAPVVINDSFPKEEHHGWKYLAFGPDARLYLQVGAPCNICNIEKEDERHATIMRMNADGSNPEIIARGVRNSVGMDWRPETHELWFTDNGRDLMGDETPPDELNRLTKEGLHFGFPYCHGKSIPDPELNGGEECSQFTPPVQELGPHVAALGLKFYTGEQFPEAYRNQIFIAEHGSWNRSLSAGPTGYRVMLVRLDKSGAATAYEEFATGWLRDGKAWGRPVDLLQLPDGSMLLSDDEAGAVYRISFNGR
ncbi:MAG: sorbosone dehydrogenase family protein [Candidatus Hydrogenedentes bacterium]|nr:sorbosone dehydrogenase family protein [Candidatus Hydrogenedentota bacterium]